LTYKTISDRIAYLLADTGPGRLVRFIPVRDQDQSYVREILMPPGLHDWCYAKDSRKRVSADFKANVRAFMGRFVKGKEPIDNKDYMKSWKDNIFELRFQLQPKKDRIRMFGAIAKPDTFVAFFQKFRSDFGGKSDPEWDKAIQRAVNDWDKYFPGEPCIASRPFKGCLKTNWFDVYTGENG
jgi:hypothetical protein